MLSIDLRQQTAHIKKPSLVAGLLNALITARINQAYYAVHIVKYRRVCSNPTL